MLPRRLRLKRGSLFPKTMSSGQALCQSPYFVMLGLPRIKASTTETRVGFIVSKKVSNRANRRNRVKRHLRHIAREYLVREQGQKFHPYTAVIIIARKPILEASFQQLSAAFRACV